MPLEYSLALKNARLAAVRDAMSNGTLEIGTAGMRKLLAVFALNPEAGIILAGLLRFSGFPQTVAARASGEAAAAQLKDATGATLVSGLAVGAEVRLSKSKITAGNVVRLDAVEIQHF